MRKFILTLAAAACMILPAAKASASVFTISPPDQDLYDLDHYKAYKWAFNWSIPAGETITSAKLTYYNIYNWADEANDSLYTTLLDNPSGTGNNQVAIYNDNQGGGNHFGAYGTRVGSWSDPWDDYAHRINLVYDFGSLGLLDELTAYAANGRLGFGIDADCHYWNTRVKFEVCTTSTPVPEPATMGLFGIGLAGMGYLKRRNKKS